MKQNQDINKLFRDQLEHFEVLPDEAVWSGIEKKLQEKKKRRVIPIWWFYGGVAAAFLIGLFFNLNFNSDIQPSGISTQPNSNSGVQSTETGNGISDDSPSQKIRKSTPSSSPSNTVNEALQLAPSQKTLRPLSASEKIAISVSDKSSSPLQKVDKTSSRMRRKNINPTAATMAVRRNSENESSEIAETQRIRRIDSTSQLIKVPSETNPVVATNPETLGNQSNMGVSVPTLVSNNPLNSAKDSVIVAQKPTNALEKLLDEKEKKTFSEQNLNRWQVTSHLAPIYFGSLAQGSPLDPALASNTKQYSVDNTSYGVGVGYAINPKISIRTGLHVVRLGYDTDEIAYYMNTNVSSRIQNLSLNAMGSSIIIESLNNVRTYNKMSLSNRYEGSLNQRMGYLEVPLEMTYRIGGKKLGVQLVGGMSTFFLNQNEIYLQSEQFNMLVGEATNLNTFHFSGNLGLGIHYGFFKKWQARIEPIFKYQFNTFSTDAGNFRPYMIGLYSGVSYSF